LTIITTTLTVADKIAGWFDLLDQPFDPEALMRIAQRRTGLDDFGDRSFVHPLTRLLNACSTESTLGVVGRSATKWDVLRFLTNLLLIQDAIAKHPLIEIQPILRPVFITGLPRSGTTFLHRLMLTDPTNRAPSVWETIYPSAVAGTQQKRIARVAGQLKAFERLAPEFRSLHPLGATSPQECSEITAHVFRSPRFDTNYYIPSYRDWLDADTGAQLPAYRFHKRFLQFLQHQGGTARRWVLKCPDHVFALPTIRAVYPDARLVFVHRDPMKVLLSQTRLTEVLRRPFIRRLDPRTLGPDESRRWLNGARHMMEVGDDAGLPDPVCHVHHLDLISDPIGTVEGVYRHFGMAFSSLTASAIEDYIETKPNGGYGTHSYHFEDHGLDEQQEREKFRPYMIRFGVATESTPTHRPAATTLQPANLQARSLLF
jgi:hypothetical protein